METPVANKISQKEIIKIWLAIIKSAGFVKCDQTGIISHSDFSFRHYGADYYFHVSVLEMTPEEQKLQPWIEHIRFGYKDEEVIEGRFLALRFPMPDVNRLISFMKNFGYSPPLNPHSNAR